MSNIRHYLDGATETPNFIQLVPGVCSLAFLPGILPPHHYICREHSTNQLLFMQNKPNFRKAQMNVSSILTTDYENIANWTLGENKPNSNPIKPNFRKAQMNVNSLITKDYRKKDDFAVRKNKPNSNPISSKAKMSANLYVIEDYENETAFRPKKTNPNKPNCLSPRVECLILCGDHSCRYCRIYIYSTRFKALKNNRYGKSRLENLHFRRLSLMKKLVLMAKRNGARKPPEILPRYFRLL